jgi:hypothetical protein
MTKQAPNIVVGCVDRHSARRMIAQYIAMTFQSVWIDAGNESVAGQVVLGYNAARLKDGFKGAGPVVAALPTISQLHELPVGGEARPSCAQMIEVTEQVSTVNVVAASLISNFCRLVLEDVKRTMLRQPVKGTDHSAVYFNVGTGSFRTVFNTVAHLRQAKKPLAPWTT